MSRLKRFSHSLATGYVVLGVMIVQTLLSVPLALHYLSREQFGLWALVMQISGYLALIDLGISNSVARILIDHKDQPGGGTYGSVIKTGALVLGVQGLILAVGGTLMSPWLPGLFAVPAAYCRDFQFLVLGQCLAMGLSFGGRVSIQVLQAHQRYDVCNYAAIGGMLANVGIMWAGFALGAGLYSLLWGAVAAYFVTNVSTLLAAIRLRLFAPAGARGHFDRKTFTELFDYGRKVFLITVGQQLINASQVIVISRTLGLEAAAIWSIATKGFVVAQQVVNRPYDFAAAGFSEMMVRGERDRLLERFRHLVVVTVSLGVWAGLAVALCNPSFLFLWTHNTVQWQAANDWLMALLIIVNATTRCYIGVITLTKDIRAIPYVYFAEGICFVLSSFLVARPFGITGIIACAVINDILWTGIYGVYRAREYFRVSSRSVLAALRSPGVYLGVLGVLFGGIWWATAEWRPLLRLAVDGAVAGIFGFTLFWRLGLSRDLRVEALGLVGRLQSPRLARLTKAVLG